MRALAEFAMRSRYHAIGASMVTAILPLLGWLSTVIVVLVVLRQGALAGSHVLLWTSLPIGTAFYFVGDPSAMIVLVGAFLSAIVLRNTLSWEFVFVGAVIYSAVTVLVMNTVLVDFLVEILAQLGSELSRTEIQSLLPFFAFSQAVIILVSLFIARWSQSALYNQGGFKKEFHQLRLSPVVSGIVVAIMAVCFLFSEQLGRWLPLLVVPLMFSALGLVHWYIGYKKLTKNWVGGFYAGLVVLFQIGLPILASLALMDSWFNIRQRIQSIQED